MPKRLARVDDIFRALADPTRRVVIEQLSKGAATVSELASAHEMALPSFLQHLKLLEESGLVRSRKRGRVRTYKLEPRRLKLAEDWVLRQRAVWERRLDPLDAHLQQMKEKR